MKKFKNNQFVFNQNTFAIRELENYIKLYKIEDDDDIEDLSKLVHHKKELLKIQEKLIEQLQILAEEEK